MLFDENDRVRASVVFRNSLEVPTDPTTVTVQINGPGTDYVTHTYGGGTVVKDTTGTYHVDFTLDLPGRWWITWTGAGTLTASAVKNFLVNGA